MRHWLLVAVAAATLWAVCGCAVQHDVKVEPVEIKPIHITMDINIKVDRQVDAFFDEVEKKAAQKTLSVETQPSAGDEQ